MKCEICNKLPNSARKFNFRGTYCTKRTLTKQKPNVRRVRAINSVGKVSHIYVCASCLRSGYVKRV